jgi:Mg-chelatase subunit ChlD
MALAAELCLVLLLDASGSIPADVWTRAAQAHADALRSEAVTRHADRNGVTVMALAFADDVWPLFGWTASPAEAAAAMERAAAETPPGGSTATGEAIHDALDALERATDCERQVIDLATDGQTTSGRSAESARDRAAALGVTINAVTVRTDRGGADPGAWARESAVTPGGFVLEAASWDAWATAIRRKLVQEVASR